MANVIKHKRGSGSDPGASDLILGELAIRTDTGKLFTKMDSGAIAEIAGGGSDIVINTLSSSSATGGGSATFNGSAYRFTLSAPPNVSAAQLLVSINGVIQKPVAGTGQPSEGFSVDGTDIILGDAPATGSDFFILTFKSLGVSEPADNSVTSAKIVDGAIVNADINASAAIAGSKISPSFTSDLTITDVSPAINFTDSNNDSDFKIIVNDGKIKIQDTTNSNAVRFSINSSGNVGIGTASPSHPLDVEVSSGDAVTRIHAAENNSTSEARLRLEVSNDFAESVVEAYDSSGVGGSLKYNHGDNAWRFTTNNDNERMRIDSSGNVGIGTTSPDNNSSYTTLTLNHSTAGGVLSFSQADTRKALLYNDSSTGDLIIQGESSRSLRFSTNGNNERMRITSAGRVGIGTASPTGDVEISGSLGLIIGNASGSGKLFADGGSTKVGSKTNHRLDLITNDTQRVSIDTSGNVGIGTSSPGRLLSIVNSSGAIAEITTNTSGNTSALYLHEGSIGSTTNGGAILYDGANNKLAICCGTTLTSERITVLRDSGQVGIGTSSPATQLEVKDSTDSRITITAGNAISQAGINFADNGGVDGIVTFDHNTRKLHLGAGTSSFTDGDITIDSSGKVGIGTASPGDFHSKASNLVIHSSGDTGMTISSGTSSDGRIFFADGTSGSAESEGHIRYDHATDSMHFATSDTVRMTFLADGDIFLGSASVADTHGSSNTSRGLVYDSDGGVGNHPFISMQHGSRSSGNPAHIKFQTAGNEEGSIRQSNLGFEISYNNTSDYRLKENVVDISDGITRLKTLKPRRYNWIADETNTTTDGFLAHEVMTAVPQAVTGTKDEVDENNKPVYQQIDQSKIVPLLVAALQEAIAKIETLETKVAALEAK